MSKIRYKTTNKDALSEKIDGVQEIPKNKKTTEDITLQRWPPLTSRRCLLAQMEVNGVTLLKGFLQKLY